MKHAYRILKEHRLIIESFYGEMDLPGYIEFKSKQIHDPDYSSNYNVLSDLRWVKFMFPASDLGEISDFFKSNINLNVDRKGCLLTIDPLQTAYSMVFNKLTSVSKVKWLVCTSLNEALPWLNCSLQEADISELLQDMKKKLVMV